MMLRAVSWRARLHLCRRSQEDFPLISALWGTALILAGAGLTNYFLGAGVSIF
jgi:hypothetical protein